MHTPITMPKDLILLSALFAAQALGHDIRAERESLLGDWKCGPTRMLGEGFEVTTSSTTTYNPDGSYEATSDIAVVLDSGKTVRTRDQALGSWRLEGRIIEIRYSRVRFLWSDDSAYTVEMGQQDANAQLKKKNWAKAKILSLGDKLITTPVESMYRGAEVVSTCVRS